MDHLGNAGNTALAVEEQVGIIGLSLLFQIEIRRNIHIVLPAFCLDSLYFLVRIFHQIPCGILFFILGKKRRELHFREKQQVAARRLIAEIQCFRKIFVHILRHGHLSHS
jgi:hypothetical protein